MMSNWQHAYTVPTLYHSIDVLIHSFYYAFDQSQPVTHRILDFNTDCDSQSSRLRACDFCCSRFKADMARLYLRAILATSTWSLAIFLATSIFTLFEPDAGSPSVCALRSSACTSSREETRVVMVAKRSAASSSCFCLSANSSSCLILS